MFEDFDSMDMYGFLDYLEESTSFNDNDIYDENFYNEGIELAESLGIYEDGGYLYVEDSFLENVMSEYNLSDGEAFKVIIDTYLEGLGLSEKGEIIDMERDEDGTWKANGVIYQSGPSFNSNKIEYNPHQSRKQEPESPKHGTFVAGQHGTSVDSKGLGYTPRTSRKQEPESPKHGTFVAGQHGTSVDSKGLPIPPKYRTDRSGSKEDHGTINMGRNGNTGAALELPAPKKHKSKKQEPESPKHGTFVAGQHGTSVDSKALPSPNPAHYAKFDNAPKKENKPDAKDVEAQIKTKRALDDKEKISQGINQTKKSISSANQHRENQTNAYRDHMNRINKDFDNRESQERADSESRRKRNAAIGVAAGVGAVGAGLLAHKAYKTHKAKKEAANRSLRRRAGRAVKRFIREEAEFINENVAFLVENYNVDENEAIEIVCYGEARTAQEELEFQQGKVEKGQRHLNSLQGELNDIETQTQQDREKYENSTKQLLATRGAGLNSLENSNKKAERLHGVGGAAAGAAAVGLAAGSAALYKRHKAKKEAEARRNRGLRGKLRRLREDEEFMIEELMESYGIFEDEYGELFIESEMVDYVMDEFDLYEEDAIDLIMECYEEDLLSENVFKSGKKYLGARKEFTAAEMNAANTKENGSDEDHEQAMDYLYDRQKYLKHSKDKFKKDAAREVGGAALATAALATGALAYKKHKNKKNKGKRRKLREDYGIFEDEYGDLFIESEMIDYVMDEFNLYEEDAIDLIMECYEEELYNLEEDAAHEVVADSHYQVSVDADRQFRQAEMDEGDADRNLARGGKNILGGIYRARRSEQDQAGEAGVRFKNRVDDGDMDGEFIDSGIQKPMGSGRRIAEDSDMGF